MIRPGLVWARQKILFEGICVAVVVELVGAVGELERELEFVFGLEDLCEVNSGYKEVAGNCENSFGRWG